MEDNIKLYEQIYSAEIAFAAFNTISIKLSFAYTYVLSIRSEISTNPLFIRVWRESCITIENLAYS